MNNSTPPPSVNLPKTQPVVLWVLHGAFMGAVAIYFFILPFLGTPAARPETRLFLALFAAISLVSAVLGWRVDLILGWQARQQARGAAAPSVASPLVTKLIISNAFFESIAIYGLVGVILGFTRPQAYAFMFASLVLLALNAARLRGWIDAEARRESMDRALGRSE